MKIKQISLLVVPAFIVVSAIASLLAPADSTAALTDKEKKACYEQWAGGYVGTSGDGKKLTDTQFDNFEKKSKCNSTRGGSCKIERFTEGASIKCERKDGEYDFGDAGWNGSADTPPGGGSTLTDPASGEGCAGVKTAFIKCDETNSGDVTDNGIWALLLMVLNIMTAGVGIIAVAGIVYGSILYTTAEDKADQVKKAIDIITNVIIGLVLFALMWAGLNFIVPGGVFA